MESLNLTVNHNIKLNSHKSIIWCIDIHPDKKHIATSSSDKTIQIHRIISCNEIKTICQISGRHDRTIRKVSFNNEGNMLAAASFDGTSSIYTFPNLSDLSNYNFLTTLKGHENEVKSISWSINDDYIATCSRDKTIWIWQRDSESNEFDCNTILEGHTQDIKEVKFHNKDNSILYSSSYDNTVKIWMLSEVEEDWLCIKTLTDHINTVWSISLCNDNLFTVGEDKYFCIYNNFNLKDPQLLFCLKNTHERAIYTLDSISNKDGCLVITSGSDNNINIYQISKEKVELIKILYNIHSEDINSVKIIALSENEYMILSGGDDSILQINTIIISNKI